MCGRFTLTADLKTIVERFSAPVGGRLVKSVRRYNIAPTQDVIVVGDDGQRYTTTMRWGLIPAWAKDPSIGNRIINARAETLTEKPSFRTALQKRRCLVVADGFYEWRKEGTVKQPVRILLQSKQPFGFAGLWDSWKSPEGEEIRSCTIITTESNELLRPIHDRMPVILPTEDEAVWLDPKITDPQMLQQLLKPYASDLMEFYPVSRMVNSPAHDTADCIVAV